MGHGVWCDGCGRTMSWGHTTTPRNWVAVLIECPEYPTDREKRLTGQRLFCSAECFEKFYLLSKVAGDVP